MPDLIDLLLARQRAGSMPGARSDGAVIALVCEGGGMRGVIAGGMVTALERMGLLDVFDILCGASAGAFTVAYFGAGQAALGTSIFIDDLAGPHFIARHRVLLHRPVMNLELLVDKIVAETKRLDTGRLLRGRFELLFVATDAKTGASCVLRGFRDATEIREGLRASARMPLIAGPPVRWRDHVLLDGGLSCPLPVEPALSAGATHAVVLLTNPFGHREPVSGRAGRVFAALLARRYGPDVRRAFATRDAVYARLQEELRLGFVRRADGATVPALGIAPATTTGRLSRFCTDSSDLRAGAESGEAAVLMALGVDASQPRPTLAWSSDQSSTC